jgi:Tol biopolymer transport system component
VVNSDGSDLRQIVPSDMNALIPSWSPDGETIVFRAVTFLPAYAEGDAEAFTVDIHSVRPDGSNLRELTSDGASGWPGWTRDGRIVFTQWTDPQHETYDLWIMDADGSNASRLEDRSISALSALGCIACTDGDGRDLLWQPIP